MSNIIFQFPNHIFFANIIILCLNSFFLRFKTIRKIDSEEMYIFGRFANIHLLKFCHEGGDHVAKHFLPREKNTDFTLTELLDPRPLFFINRNNQRCQFIISPLTLKITRILLSNTRKFRFYHSRNYNCEMRKS